MSEQEQRKTLVCRTKVPQKRFDWFFSFDFLPCLYFRLLYEKIGTALNARLVRKRQLSYNGGVRGAIVEAHRRAPNAHSASL